MRVTNDHQNHSCSEECCGARMCIISNAGVRKGFTRNIESAIKIEHVARVIAASEYTATLL